MDNWLLRALIGLALGAFVLWMFLVVVLLRNKPAANTAKQALRLVPDCLRLFRNLVTDRTVPKRVRIRIWLLLAYLASPIDLIPDFLPVIGYVDDVIVVALTLRSVIRATGLQTIERHWTGTSDGLAALLKTAGVK